MPEYELLELLLFNAIQRIDVKPLAKRLLAEFGDLNGVIAASLHRILKVEGANDRVYYHLRLVEAFGHRMAQAQVLQRDVVVLVGSAGDLLSNRNGPSGSGTVPRPVHGPKERPDW